LNGLGALTAWVSAEEVIFSELNQWQINDVGLMTKGV
jgi:hypothetical protein